MRTFGKMEDTVRDILSWNPNARDNDFILIYQVYTVINPLLLSKPFGEILMLHSHYGLPSFETIFRARRKVQQHNPDLRATKKIKSLRTDNEDRYKVWLKGRREYE